MSTSSTDLLLTAMLEELRLIRHVLERDQPSRLTRTDRETLARLLPAIGGVYGSDTFLAAEIATHRAPAIRVARGTLTARQVGRLLKRAEGTAVDGYVVTRLGAEDGAVLWQVAQTL